MFLFLQLIQLCWVPLNLGTSSTCMNCSRLLDILFLSQAKCLIDYLLLWCFPRRKLKKKSFFQFLHIQICITYLGNGSNNNYHILYIDTVLYLFIYHSWKIKRFNLSGFRRIQFNVEYIKWNTIMTHGNWNVYKMAFTNIH